MYFLAAVLISEHSDQSCVQRHSLVSSSRLSPVSEHNSGQIALTSIQQQEITHRNKVWKFKLYYSNKFLVLRSAKIPHTFLCKPNCHCCTMDQHHVSRDVCISLLGLPVIPPHVKVTPDVQFRNFGEKLNQNPSLPCCFHFVFVYAHI